MAQFLILTSTSNGDVSVFVNLANLESYTIRHNRVVLNLASGQEIEIEQNMYTLNCMIEFANRNPDEMRISERVVPAVEKLH